MEYRFNPQGVCSREMLFDIDPKTNVIENLVVTGGCNGNLKGINSLIRGMKVEDVIVKLSGITCLNKNTSCPDQIARALIKYLEER